MPSNLKSIKPAGADLLSSYRKRTWYLFAIVCAIFFLPGSILIYSHGFRVLAASVLCMLVILVGNSYAIKKDRKPYVSVAVFVGVLMTVVGLSIVQRGEMGAFWAFPAILFINFVAFGQLSRIYTIIFLVGISAIMFYSLDPMIASRAATGLLVTVLLTNLYLGMIENLQKEIVEQSNHDPLTGAFNRREMDAVLQEAIERKRRGDVPASLLVFDVDQFKSVNDTYGHAVGDKVLKMLVQRVDERARFLDRLFRMGGEEFMLFLPDTDMIGAAILAEELRVIVAETDFIEGRTVTISIGVTELGHGETVDEWIRRGDDALYTAKSSGRNQSVEAKDAETYVVPGVVGEFARECDLLG